jgi:hypothetical protein
MVAFALPGAPQLFGYNFNDYNAGSWYLPNLPQTTFVNGTGALQNGTILYLPFVPRWSHTFQKIGFYNSSAAESGNKFRMGIADSLNGRPNNLLQDGGETTLGAAAGFNQVTISQRLTQGLLYFLMVNANASISGPRVNGSLPTGSFQDAIAAMDMGVTTPTAGPVPPFAAMYTQASAYGALPTPGAVTSGTTAVNIPLLWIRG